MSLILVFVIINITIIIIIVIELQTICANILSKRMMNAKNAWYFCCWCYRFVIVTSQLF